MCIYELISGRCPLVAASLKLHFLCYTIKADIPGVRGIIILEFVSFLFSCLLRGL